METKEVLGFLKIIFWLLLDASKLFDKLQKEPWYMDPHKEWIDSFSIEKTQNILEIGTGTGQLAKYVQEKYGCRVTAIDYSQKMLKRAEGSKVQFIHADATKLPFVEESFDIVISSSLVNIVSDPQKAIAEMFRVSKKGCPITFLVPSETMNAVNAKKYIQKNNIQGFSKSALLFWTRNARIFSQNELEEILKKIGYQNSIQTNYFFDRMLISFTLEK